MKQTPEPNSSGRAAHGGTFPVALRALCAVLAGLSGLAGTGCVTVRPQERAILADPLMRFDTNLKHEAELQHVLDNREGSFGGGAVQGGGCGCN